MNVLEKFGNIPINNSMLYQAIGDYRFPRNKVAALEKRGDLIRLKNGLFVVSPEISRTSLSRELIANHLYGPSYVSYQTALSFYGLIPEKVFVVRSATFRRAKHFENAIGRFEYSVVPQACFPIGVNLHTVKNQFTGAPQYSFLIASPGKALCDLILASKQLGIRSTKAMQAFLEDDLRIDLSAFQATDTEIIRQCSVLGRKRAELELLAKLLSNSLL